MNVWVRRLRAVVAMGLLWALGGLAVGGLIELVDNVLPAAHGFTRRVDMWPQLLAMLAVPHGILFAIVLGLARGGRRFEEFTLAHFAGYGAVAGALFAVVALANGAGPLFIAVMMGLSTIGGASSLALARLAEHRGLLGAGGRADAARPLPGGSD